MFPVRLTQFDEVSGKNHQRLCWLCTFITKLMDEMKEDIKFVGVAGVRWRRMIGCEHPWRERPWGQNHYYYHYYYFWSGTIRRGREQDVFMPTVKLFTVAVSFRGSHITKCTLSQRSHKASIWHLEAHTCMSSSVFLLANSWSSPAHQTIFSAEGLSAGTPAGRNEVDLL